MFGKASQTGCALVSRTRSRPEVYRAIVTRHAHRFGGVSA